MTENANGKKLGGKIINLSEINLNNKIPRIAGDFIVRDTLKAITEVMAWYVILLIFLGGID